MEKIEPVMIHKDIDGIGFRKEEDLMTDSNWIEIILLGVLILLSSTVKLWTKKKVSKLDGLGLVNKEGAGEGMILK
jgi:hypothetical protein